MKFKPTSKQLKGAKFIVERPAGAIFGDPGFGKTATTLIALEVLKEQGVINKTLILVSKRILPSVWPKELKKWGFDLTATIVSGPPKTRLNKLKKDTDIYLMTYDGIKWLEKQDKKIREQFDVLVVDESSKFKGYSTERFKVMKTMLDNFDRRYILTGTPTPNNMQDIFSQIYIIDQGESLGQYITHFRRKYFDAIHHKDYTQWELCKGSERQIYKKLEPYVLRIPYEQGKKPVYNYIEVELPTSVMKKYKQMEDDFCIEVQKEVVLAANAAVKTGKLRQIANGHIKTGNTFKTLHKEKLLSLQELIEELQGNPLLVGTEYDAEIVLISKLLKKMKKKFAVIDGKTSQAQALKIEAAWNKGELEVLVGNISSIAHGLNLQEVGHHLCYYSLTWNLENYIQFMKRLWRRGQKKQVYCHFLMCLNTVDYDVMKTLDKKNRNQQDLLNAFLQRVA